MKIVFAILLIVHGIIVAAQSSTSFKPKGGTPNPAWMKWFPANLGQSWLFSKSGIEKMPAVKDLGYVWIIAGVALILAGLGVLGVVIPVALWRALALVGAVLSLIMLIVYFHPFYIIGFSASLLLLIALLLKSWPIFTTIGL